MPPIVRAFLRHRDEQFARATIGVQADVDVTFVARHVELVRERLPRIGQALATRLAIATAAFLFLLLLSPSLFVLSGWLCFEPSR